MVPAYLVLDFGARLRGLAWYVRHSDRGFDSDACALEVIAGELDTIRRLREDPTRGRVLRWAHEILGIADHVKRTDAALALEASALRSLGSELQGLASGLRSTGEFPTAHLREGSPADHGPTSTPDEDTGDYGPAPLGKRKR